MEILFKKVVGLVNYYVLVNCYALGPTGQYSVLITGTVLLYFRWGTPSSPGSPPGSKHPGLKGGPSVPGQEPGLKGDL